MIATLISQAHMTAVEKGWWESPRSIGEQIALMHSELSEALEEIRNGRDPAEVYYSDGGKPEGFAAELADVLIRIFDTCGRYNVPLGSVLDQKMAYNKSRPYRHGNKTM